METVNIITFIGICATFIATIIATAVSVYYGRKNLKTSKYIETITTERIKWLSLIRNEVSELITNIQFSMKEYLDDIYMKTLEREDYNIPPEDEAEYLIRQYGSDIGVGVRKSNANWSASDYVTKLRLLQLRLNPKEDKKIIESLGFFIDLYSSSNVHRDKAEDAIKHINIIIAETQAILKNEWEKVKQESQGIRK